jgi:hypothetical protein
VSRFVVKFRNRGVNIGGNMKKRVISWRIAVVILFIFGAGFLTGKLTEKTKLTSLEGYKINLATIESDALASEVVATPSDAEVATPSDVEVATPSDVEMATPSDVEMATPSDVEMATPSDVEMATPSDVEIATSPNVKNDDETSEDKNKQTQEQNLSYNAEKITSKEINEIKKAKSSITVIYSLRSSSVYVVGGVFISSVVEDA